MSRRLILDANLLVLLVVGSVGPHMIERHKRLRAYRPSDYDLLLDHAERFGTLVLTPNVLTEASNLIRQAGEPWRTDFGEALAALVRQYEEQYRTSSSAVERGEYGRLGLTDAVLLDLAAEEGTLLTADLDLYLAASRAGYAATNFAHLQAAAFQG